VVIQQAAIVEQFPVHPALEWDEPFPIHSRGPAGEIPNSGSIVLFAARGEEKNKMQVQQLASIFYIGSLLRCSFIECILLSVIAGEQLRKRLRLLHNDSCEKLIGLIALRVRHKRP
jgi:hypothetical protein